MNFTHEDKLCIPIPFFHCFGCVLAIMACVTHGGTQADTIGHLSRFVPIAFRKSNSIPINSVDAAIAEANFTDIDRQIYWIGNIAGINNAPTLDSIVMKTVRTTQFTTGKILSLNATVDVTYGDGKVARFENQIITSNMSAGGDSGSLILDSNKKAVGLLFAGSSTVTIANRITEVEKQLSIKLWP